VKWLLFKKEQKESIAVGFPHTVFMGLVIVTAITLIISLFLPMQILSFALLSSAPIDLFLTFLLRI